MIAPDDMLRVLQLQQRLIAATFREIKKDGHHKSSEAEVSVSMHLPSAFNQGDGVKWSVSAYSYLLKPDGRLDEWYGRTPSEAIGKAETDIDGWLMVSEMEEFESHFSPIEDSEGV